MRPPAPCGAGQILRPWGASAGGSSIAEASQTFRMDSSKRLSFSELVDLLKSADRLKSADPGNRYPLPVNIM